MKFFISTEINTKIWTAIGYIKLVGNLMIQSKIFKILKRNYLQDYESISCYKN